MLTAEVLLELEENNHLLRQINLQKVRTFLLLLHAQFFLQCHNAFKTHTGMMHAALCSRFVIAIAACPNMWDMRKSCMMVLSIALLYAGAEHIEDYLIKSGVSSLLEQHKAHSALHHVQTLD